MNSKIFQDKLLGKYEIGRLVLLVYIYNHSNAVL